MNTARLARRLQEAKGDPVVMAEAIGDEFDDPVHGYVTREMFEARMDALEVRVDGQLTALRAEMGALEARIDKRLAELEMRLLRSLILAQVAGFLAILVAVLLK